jgi:hypothetical protein
MNELFNWGGETPEQRQARLQWEQELLMEQARARMMAMQAGAVGGGSKKVEGYVVTGYVDNGYFGSK